MAYHTSTNQWFAHENVDLNAVGAGKEYEKPKYYTSMGLNDANEN
jgi:hypothetical protein